MDPVTNDKTPVQRPWKMVFVLVMALAGAAGIYMLADSSPLHLRLDHLQAGRIADVLAFDPQNPMLFNTGLFLVLFVAFLAIYQAAARLRLLRMAVTILFSLFFYWKSSAECCFILLGVAVADYWLGQWMGRENRLAARRLIVWINVAMNVGMLVYFKYFNLLLSTFASISGSDFSPLSIVLPAGISFFSFRSISYIVDLYRGKMQPCDSLWDYVFFLTFFPPLLAGPVVRATDFLPQIRQNRIATHAMVSEGLFLVMCGLVKKVVIADYISGNFVDRIFDNPGLYSGFENLMGAIAYTLQLYCDFSGYSDMAIGLALILGFRFKDNFDAPFKSQSPTDFWRRWHISLSTWLRDYIYIPLGGNRKGAVRQYGNLLTTMLIGGIWHGASWMYLLWGAYHGVLLAVHKLIKKIWRLPSRLVGTRLVVILNILLTMALTVAGMILFRSESLDHAGTMLRQIFTDFRPQVIVPFIVGYPVVLTIIVGAYIMHYLPRRHTDAVRSRFAAVPLIWQAVILAIVLFIVIQTRQSSLVPFLYLKY